MPITTTDQLEQWVADKVEEIEERQPEPEPALTTGKLIAFAVIGFASFVAALILYWRS